MSLESFSSVVLHSSDELFNRVAEGDVSTVSEEYGLFSALRWIERQTHTRTNHSQMLVGLREGLFLREFVKRTSSKRVLEIGTFTGYSLACLADGVKTEGGIGSVDAIEINRELDYIISEGLQRAGVDSFVNVIFGDATALLKCSSDDSCIGEASASKYFQGKEYDLVFIDADKRQYPRYLELVYPMVKRGGYILADNVNWYGKGLDKSSEVSSGKDSKTSGIVSFNRMVESSAGVESYLLDIRDGLLIVRKT